MLYDQFFIHELKTRADLVRGFLLVALFVIVFASTGASQEMPKALLVDEHGLFPCDDTLGRLDAWYAELGNNPNSVGLAVISGPPEEKHRIAFRQSLMEASAKARRVSETLKLKYVRAASPGPVMVQLWRIPAGAQEPRIENVDNTHVLPNDIKPFLLGKEYPDYLNDNDIICPGKPSDQRIFAAFLKDNQSARGNIVVRARTISKAQTRAAQILQTFRRRYGIPPSRFRVFPRKRSVPRNNLEPIVEYWYLP